MALKWEDELYETECTGLDVAVTRTGMVSLTATFKPVEIDGTMVSRAYVHNFTIYKNLALGIGDKLMVYKANKIIPQIAENRTKSGELDYELVFDGDLPAQTAEDVFRIFNLEHPNGYRGRSMSVSDIVWMEGIGYWFCDSIGFRQIKFAGEKCCWRKFDG